MKLKVRADHLTANSCRVWLDDLEITDRTQHLEFQANIGELNTARIQLIVDEVEIDAEVQVEYPVLTFYAKET
jgi:hypothetical protein